MNCQESDEIICRLKECTKKTKKFALQKDVLNYVKLLL